jgi:PAS domain S-box-containing protein
MWPAMPASDLSADALAILDSAPVLAAGADAAGRVVLFNRACEALTGHRRAEVLGQPFLALLVPGPWHARVRRRFEETPPEELALPHRNPWRTTTGEERLIEWRCFPAVVAGAPCILGIGHDVTELSRAERRLAVRHVVTRILGEARSVEGAVGAILVALCEALDFAAGGLWMPDGERLRCRDFVSRAHDDGSALRELSRSLLLDHTEGLPGAAWTTGKPVWVQDLGRWERFRRRTAAQADGMVAGLAFPLVGQDLIGVLEFFSHEARHPDPQLLDVLESIATQIGAFVERVRAEEQAQRAQRRAEHESQLKGELLDRISHELRTPLSAIQSRLILLREEIGDPALRERGLERAMRNTAVLRLLADDLVDAARIARGGTLAMSMEPVDIAEVIRHVVEEAVVAARAKAVRISLDVRPGDARIPGDPLRLLQVFGNIVGNAVKFTPPDGDIAVSLDPDGAAVTVRVADGGVGMTEAQLASAFESYWQAGTSPGGLGLGLTIARHIVQLHRGSIRASSDGLGRGSTFVVSLPRD